MISDDDMRILLVDKLGCIYPEIGYATKIALEKLGNEVRIFHYRKWKLQHFPYTNLLLNKLLVSSAIKWKADLVFVGKGESILPGTINTIRKQGIKAINWDNDEPFGELLPFNKINNIEEYDAFFVYDHTYLDRIKEINPITYAIPPGADPYDIHKEVIPLINRDYPADICLVGTAYPKRIKLLEPFNNLQMRLAGPGWNKKDNPLRSQAMPPVTLDKMTKLYNESKIILNPYGDHPNFFIPNNRTFEIPATRSFQLTDMPRDAKRYFKLKKEIVVYKDQKEFKELIDYYLDNNEEREKIAQAGYKRVEKEHTIYHRIESIMKVVSKL